MSTSTTGATSALLKILTSVNAELSIGFAVNDVVIPLIIGLIKEIKTSLVGTTVEYTVTLAATNAILDAIIATGQSDVATVNKELARFGLGPLAIPGAPPVPPVG